MTPDDLKAALQREDLTASGEWRLRVGFLEERTGALESQVDEGLDDLREMLAQVRADVAHLRGWIAGSALAVGVVGAVLAFIARAVFK
jgi:hypothetical protein